MQIFVKLNFCTKKKWPNNTRGGNHRGPHDTTRYMAHDTDNITIQHFCDNQYIPRQSYNYTSRYLSNV